MPYRIKGTLKLPSGQPATGVDIEFISRRNYSPLMMDLSSIIKTTSTGAYDITLEYGEYAVVVYWGCNQPSHIGKLFVFSDTAAGLDLQTLLQQADWQPATPEYIQQIQDWLAQAGASASQAVNSAAAAKASENVVEADRAEVASNKTIVVNAQADVSAKAADVTAKAAQVATNTATVNEKTPLAIAAADTASQKAVAAAASDASARDSATRAENAALAMTGAILDGGQCDLSSGFYPQPLTVNGKKYSTVWYVKVGGTVGGITYDAGDKLQYTTANNGFYFRIDARDDVVSVNGKKGSVTLNAQEVGADPVGAASLAVSQHAQKDSAHKISGVAGLEQSLLSKAPAGYGIGEPARPASAQEQTLGGIFRDLSILYGGICIPYDGTPTQIFVGVALNENKLRFGVRIGDTSTPIRFFDALSTNTTTVDSNGFIKRASPVARLYGNNAMAKSDSEYKVSGCAAVNDEAQGVFAARETAGLYRVTGCLGFATDGWYIETPADSNGNKLLFVEYEQHDNGDIVIKTFSPDYSTGRCSAGEPKDIPHGRWIDLRLSMPAKS